MRRNGPNGEDWFPLVVTGIVALDQVDLPCMRAIHSHVYMGSGQDILHVAQLFPGLI